MTADSVVVGYLHLTTVDIVVGFLIAALLLRPFMTLAHELGHAFVALRITTGPVLVQVGRQSPMVEVVGERLRIRFSMLPAKGGVSWRGFCASREGESTYLELCGEALAGPAVTALWGAAFFLAVVKSKGGPGWITATCLFCCAEAVVSLLENLKPRRAKGEGWLRQDGAWALECIRQWRAGYGAPPRVPGGELRRGVRNAQALGGKYKVRPSSSGEPRR